MLTFKSAEPDASCLQEKVLRLDECMECVDTEAVQLLLTYMYSPDSTSVITRMDMQQLERAAVLADIWAMSRFLELCDAHLHGALFHVQDTDLPFAAWPLICAGCG